MSMSLLDCGLSVEEHDHEMSDYAGAVARWCPGCGDHAVLASVQRLLADENLKPEQTMFVSGIGCSSRFPHYLNTYGFHGIHGRALPVATGIKMARPDLHTFAVMGDGDCCSIGAAHWVHATRYNVDMVALLLDNNIYGLTKKQTSPTTPQGFRTSTQPKGSFLPSLDPISATLGISNVSFVAQTADWAPAHMFATLKAAYRHPGFSFVRILQRCPVWTMSIFREAVQKPQVTELLIHEDGIRDPDVEALYTRHLEHDPSDLDRGRALARENHSVRLGLFFKDASRPRYDALRTVPARTAEARMEILESELDRHAV